MFADLPYPSARQESFVRGHAHAVTMSAEERTPQKSEERGDENGKREEDKVMKEKKPQYLSPKAVSRFCLEWAWS